nr:DUF4383 domain-containing protein [Mycobacterium scrofulaceum]
MDPGRFRSGRWLLLAEGVLVSAFGIAGLVSAALHPRAGPTGTPVLGLAATPAESAVLLALGVAAIAAVARRRAAITVTALSAVAYTLLLFFSSVATARAMPTPLGFHAADIVLHGVLAAVNFALLMWLIPDELGDETWVPRRGRDQGQASATAADRPPDASPPAVTAPQVGARRSSSPAPAEAARPRPTMPVDAGTTHRDLPERSGIPATHKPVAPHLENSTPANHFAAAAPSAVPSRRVAPVVAAVAVLAAVIGVVVWIRRR